VGLTAFVTAGMIRIMTKLAEEVKALGAEIRYQTSVESCRQPRPKTWCVSSAPLAHPLETSIEDFDKLVVATGTFSVPAVPSFAETYMHPRRTPVKDLEGLLTIHTSHLSDDTVQKALYAKQRRIAIIGGSKSALDAAERLASVRLQ
jgi:cation diffusion facilitator CzcD-associated flavoprotein CzcO